jgi:hypothetical protein
MTETSLAPGSDWPFDHVQAKLAREASEAFWDAPAVAAPVRSIPAASVATTPISRPLRRVWTEPQHPVRSFRVGGQSLGAVTPTRERRQLCLTPVRAAPGRVVAEPIGAQVTLIVMLVVSGM